MCDDGQNKQTEELDESLATAVETDIDEAAESTAEQEDQVAEQVQALEDEVAKLKDTMLREQAETQNIRRRLQQKAEDDRKRAIEKLVVELLPVIDNLERAIEAAGDNEHVKAYKEGVELTYKSFVDTLAKFNVQQLNPLGEPFDPQFHEALTMVVNPEMEPNSVMDVMQKGYVLNDRLVRAAKVVVTKEA